MTTRARGIHNKARLKKLNEKMGTSFSTLVGARAYKKNNKHNVVDCLFDEIEKYPVYRGGEVVEILETPIRITTTNQKGN